MKYYIYISAETTDLEEKPYEVDESIKHLNNGDLVHFKGECFMVSRKIIDLDNMEFEVELINQ